MSKHIWIHKDFEEYLQEMFMKEEPCVLDDDLPDAFSEWLYELGPEILIEYVDKYTKIKVMQALENVETYINTTVKIMEKS